MFKVNYQKLNSQLNGAAGGITNEQRFEMEQVARTRKRLTIPARNSGGTMEFDQGWNDIARQKDVVKLTAKQGDKFITMIVDRVDLEQVVFAMAQGDETIKYFKASARAQRYWSEPARKL